MAAGVRAQGRGHVCKPTVRKQQEMNAGTQLACLFTQSGAIAHGPAVPTDRVGLPTSTNLV